LLQRIPNALQDLDEEEIKRKFFQKGEHPQANRVEYLEREIDEAEADPTKAGALLRRNKAQDEYVFQAIFIQRIF
jgi:hypothetical protein